MRLLLFSVSLAAAATVNLDWNVSWVDASPDGYTRKVIGVNGYWPPPTVNVTKGDRVVINATNSLGDENLSLHAHGLFFNGTNSMDGAAGVTQWCIYLKIPMLTPSGIPPGSSILYNYTIVNQAGTFWIHSHVHGQYPDGLRSPFIIHDTEEPYTYDEEYVVTLSDWYHDRMKTLIPVFMNIANPTGAEPVPKSALINDQSGATFSFLKGKTYRLRIVNMSAFAAFNFWLEDHEMSVIEVDGVHTEPRNTTALYITAAQRYSVLVTAKDDTTSNYAMVGSMDTTMFDTVPSGLNPNATAHIVYGTDWPLPKASYISSFPSWDDTTLSPLQPIPPYKYDTQHQLDVKMDVLKDGENYAFFNNITYVPPKVPTLYSVMSSGDQSTDPIIYGPNTNQILLNHMNVVQLVVNNYDPGKHPFHLHGHTFQVISREYGAFDPIKTIDEPKNPLRRDVIYVPPNGHVVLRFVADNPGVWLFHCHIEWHMVSGLVATFIEAPDLIQSTQTIPDSHYAVCAQQKIPTSGNAAANIVNWDDLTGANRDIGELPSGFTAKGYGAMAGCILSAVLGLSAVITYGITGKKNIQTS
ncbi:Iron transport multicopper oxidase [Neolecta irregularis DAH-3]|uniref:Iron transport multicopper oxidase n=1 Tax=Neolecta irregularis (strain DAH-3) TaxID=1198029 RepID=A0A1U7LVI9_NEOID|nr:Iron transport multicopper oxidase [Neolecta irregularis DAH-3]|eukprot:OLL26531.1 Iron transport multicopper oxidase [Neolecta irregularis DAH-3]